MFRTSARRTSPLGLLILSGVLISTGTAGATQLREVGERVFPFQAGGDVSVRSENGAIRVEAWDRAQVRVQITRRVTSKDRAQAEALMRDLRADVTVERGRIEIESRMPKRTENPSFWDRIGGGASAGIDYVLQVPERTNLELRNYNGAIHVSGTRGGVEIRGTNGALRLLDVDGSALARTTNGAIDARIRAVGKSQSVELTTTNGGISVTLPSDLKANLDAATTNGRVTVGFPLGNGSLWKSRSVRGTIGGGGARIVLRTTNGAIVIRKSERKT